MTAQDARTEQGTNVGDETIVADDQLVELTAGREILVLEAERLAGFRLAAGRSHDRIIDCRDDIPLARKETGDLGEPVAQRVARGGGDPERLTRSRNAIEACRQQTLPTNRGQLIALMLLDERDLRHHRCDTVPKTRAGCWRDPGQDPRAALLIHQPPSAIDRVH